jgi:NAD(P)-dependent dehydrogenase (short-subunit alcohol dehydrogenase family)
MNTKTVVVTGASSGIGFAITRAYLLRGDNVVANARTLERLQAAAEQLGQPANLLLVPGDIAEPTTAQRLVAAAIERFGQVDVLVNNAGIFSAKPFTDYTPEDVQALVDTNLKGFFFAAQAAAAHMRERRTGHIVNITASLANQPSQAVPAALPVLIKGGINHATKALALELAPHNIQVKCGSAGYRRHAVVYRRDARFPERTAAGGTHRHGGRNRRCRAVSRRRDLHHRCRAACRWRHGGRPLVIHAGSR